MKLLIVGSIIAIVSLTGCGDPEAFTKGEVAKQWCTDMRSKPDNLISGTKGDVNYRIAIQNCTKGVLNSYKVGTTWQEHKAQYSVK